MNILRDRQRDELSIGDPGRTARRPCRLGQEIVHADVKCADKGVEVGVHEASFVDVASATPSVATFPRPLAETPTATIRN
jgi:hypothetical protein